MILSRIITYYVVSSVCKSVFPGGCLRMESLASLIEIGTCFNQTLVRWPQPSRIRQMLFWRQGLGVSVSRKLVFVDC